MKLIEHIKTSENTPIYLALTLGVLGGLVLGMLLSLVTNGMTFNTRVSIGSSNGSNNAFSDSNNVSGPERPPHPRKF